jgi:hypothetical protein
MEVVMKRSISVFAIALVTVVLGCENGPLDPITSSAPSVSGLSKAATPVVRIPLGGTPREPYPNSGLVYDINGFVDYSMVRLNGSLFSVHVTAQALLIPREGDQGMLNLNCSSDHIVSVPEEGVVFLEVRYLFPERNDRLAMFITFQITTDNVEVADMWLDFVE